MELIEKIRRLSFVNNVIDLFLSSDMYYRNTFKRQTGRAIYLKHLEESFVCCVFCRHLHPSIYHNHHFACSKGVYDGYGPLLPGTFPFTGNYNDNHSMRQVPWIYRKTCKFYKRLEEKKYFRNLKSLDSYITTANYETLEGITSGISRGKRPCHICAFIDIGIYNWCYKNNETEKSSPCPKITHEVSVRYAALFKQLMNQ